MILIPIRHDQTTVRRYPWVTIALIAICVVAFFGTGRYSLAPREDRALYKNVPQAMEWHLEHPYLELDPEFEQIFLTDREGDELRELLGAGLGRPRPEDPRTIELEQRHLDRATSRAIAAYRTHPLMQWGLKPDRVSPPTLITHMFLHAGWLHLIGNMFLLFLAGPYIEDVWGRPLYAGFYVLAGLVAALFHLGANPDSVAPLVGASGAIAGVMGVFFVRYATTKIKFFYFLIFVRGTFDAPAWVMLPLWFGQQALLAGQSSSSNVDSGVAYWAHVGGFLAGVAAALAMRQWRIEERFIDPSIEAKVTLRVEGNEAVDQALAERDAGNAEEAYRLLCKAVESHPDNIDAATALWDMADELDRVRDAAALLLRSIVGQIRAGHTEQAIDQWLTVQKRVADVKGDPRLFVRVARTLIDEQRGRDAIAPLRLAMLNGGTRLDPTTAMQIARAARQLDPRTACAAARVALARPELDPQLRKQAEQLLNEVTPPPVLA